MSDDALVAVMQEAMTLLHWELRDLFNNTFAYGNVGTEAELSAHLRSGNHLDAAQSNIVLATLNDGLHAIGDPLRLHRRT